MDPLEAIGIRLMAHLRFRLLALVLALPLAGCASSGSCTRCQDTGWVRESFLQVVGVGATVRRFRQLDVKMACPACDSSAMVVIWEDPEVYEPSRATGHSIVPDDDR